MKDFGFILKISLYRNLLNDQEILIHFSWIPPWNQTWYTNVVTFQMKSVLFILYKWIQRIKILYIGFVRFAKRWHNLIIIPSFQYGSITTTPSAKNHMCQINGKAEYPWHEGNALYLVRSEECAVLWVAKTVLNHQRKTLPNTINPFEESNSRKTPGICDQTQGNNFPSWQRSVPCCYSG